MSFLKVLCLGSLLVCCTSCVTPSTLLVNDQGAVHRCAAWGTGVQGMMTASGIHGTCVADMKKLGYIVLPDVWMGVTYQKGTTIVERLTVGGGAAQAGILVGDRFLLLDGKPSVSSIEMTKAMADKKAGDIVHITLERNGQELRLPVMLQLRGA